MDYRIHIEDEQGNTIFGTILYLDGNGSPLGSGNIPVSGITLTGGLIDAADNIGFQADGFYTLVIPKSSLLPENEIILTKKPDTIMHYAIGAIAGFILAKLLKI